jgi:hypothetical protein
MTIMPELNLSEEIAKNNVRSICSEPSGTKYTYYFDLSDVTELTYDPFDESSYTQIVYDSVSSSCVAHFSLHSFSSKENASAWGKDVGLPVGRIFYIEEHLSSFFDSLGYDPDNFDPEVDSLPKWVSDYESNFIKQQFQATGGNRLLGYAFTGLASPVFQQVSSSYGTGTPLPFIGTGHTAPFLTWPFNNSLSSYRCDLSIGCVFKSYKKSFYKKGFPPIFNNVFSVSSFGLFETVNFNVNFHQLNDEISSFYRVSFI